MDPNVIALLVDSMTGQIFNEVFKRRRIQLKDLRESLIRSAEPDAARRVGGVATAERKPTPNPVIEGRIENAVQKLKAAKLIDERQAPIKDFSTIYITENGLNAERELRLATPREQVLLPNR
jgi:hypothetical protein